MTSCRADGLDDEILLGMKKAGCRLLLIGFESGSEKILKSMNKKVNINLYYDSIRLLRKHNMHFYANFMIGMPEETEQTVRETERFAIHNGLIFGVSYVTPFPGTKLYNDIRHKIADEKEYLFSLAEFNFSKEPIINLTKMSTKKLISLRNHTVINMMSSLIKNNLRYIPMFLILSASQVYLFLFNMKNPFLSKMLRPITKTIYRFFSKRNL